MLHQTFPKLKMFCTKRRPISCWLSLTAVARLRHPGAGQESEAFIEVPLFDEPMMLAIYEDDPWANRDRVRDVGSGR